MITNKIAFFTEVPTAHLDELHPIIDGHFCIASECLKDSTYFEWYKNRPKDAYVILDNGMFEEGKPLDVQTLFEVADAIKPNVVFAPDQVGDYYSTIEMSFNFAEKCREQKSPWKVGFIPQGENISQLVDCYYQMAVKMIDNPLFGPIGISFLNDRPAMLEEIIRRYGSLGPLWHHFLGMYDLSEIATWPEGVHTMDTIKPFKAAFYNQSLDQPCRGLGKWNTNMKMETELQYAHLYRNLGLIHKNLTRTEVPND